MAIQIGDVYGEWTVIGKGDKPRYWKCQCSCENKTIKDVQGHSLLHGKSTSCGCMRKLLNSANKVEDLTGQKFGDWTVLKYEGHSMWLCECSCKNKTRRLVKSQSLKSGVSTSCGHNTTGFKDLTGTIKDGWKFIHYIGNRIWECECINCGEIKNINIDSLNRRVVLCKCSKVSPKLIDLSGKTFGYLEVIRYVGGNKWECKCTNCGSVVTKYSHNLRRSDTISCGCLDIKPLSREYIVEKLMYFIDYNGRKPYRFEVEELIDRSQTRVAEYIKRYNLEGYINKEFRSKAELELSTLFMCNNHNIRNLVPGLELDLYFPDVRFGIEYDGLYWHSELFKDKNYHINKTKAFANAGIHVIHINEYEWLNSSTKIKLIDIINRKLNRQSTVVYGRNTKIKIVDNNIAHIFYDKYHLQGGINSKLNIALIYNDDIVAMMSFSESRFDSTFDWEITRLAMRVDTIVLGGAEKLFKKFIEMNNPERVVAYCDASKFLGKVYFRLGFKLIKLTDPSYVWSDSYGNILSRYQTMKYKLLELGLGSEDQTEDEIMTNQGFFKIYDCGNLKFAWENPNN